MTNGRFLRIYSSAVVIALGWLCTTASASTTLFDLAKTRFGAAASQKLFDAAQEGSVAAFDHDEKFPLEQLIWLCSDRSAQAAVHAKGVWITGATITSPIYLMNSTVPFPLWFVQCKLGDICLTSTRLDNLALSRTTAGNLNIAMSTITHHVSLQQSTLTRGLTGGSADIRGSLWIRSSDIHGGPNGLAIDLAGSAVGGGISISDQSTVTGLIGCANARLRSFNVSQSTVKVPQGDAVNCDMAVVAQDISLSQHCVVEGEVSLNRAQARLLDLGDSTLVSKGGYAFDGEGLRLETDAFFRRGFTAQGEVRLTLATIQGTLECQDATFACQATDRAAVTPNWLALNLESIAIGHNLNARNIHVTGVLSLLLGNVAGLVTLDGATVDSVTVTNSPKPSNTASAAGALISPALVMGKCRMEGGISMCAGFRALGGVSLETASVGRDVVCDGGEMSNPGGLALSADGLHVKGSVMLRSGYKADGLVSMKFAQIGDTLECEGSLFKGSQGVAIAADGAEVGGAVFLRQGFEAQGVVILRSAKIGLQLDCTAGSFHNPKGIALNAEQLTVGQDLLCEGELSSHQRAKPVAFEGRVLLKGSHISGNVFCKRGTVGQCRDGGVQDENAAFDLSDAHVGGTVEFSDAFQIDGLLRLRLSNVDGSLVLLGSDRPVSKWIALDFCKVGVLYDNLASWPQKGRLLLNGFVFRTLDENAQQEVRMRLDWLRRQGSFVPQPYEQMAGVFRQMGRADDAIDILIAKEDDAGHTPIGAIGNWISKLVFDHGYRPWKAAYLSAVVILFGAVVFWLGYQAKVFTATKAEAYGSDGVRLNDPYPPFNALIYSIDVFTPLIDLLQADYWTPSANRGGRLFWKVSFGRLLQLCVLCQIVLGWTLSTFLAIGMSGLIRQK